MSLQSGSPFSQTTMTFYVESGVNQTGLKASFCRGKTRETHFVGGGGADVMLKVGDSQRGGIFFDAEILSEALCCQKALLSLLRSRYVSP